MLLIIKNVMFYNMVTVVIYDWFFSSVHKFGLQLNSIFKQNYSQYLVKYL